MNNSCMRMFSTVLFAVIAFSLVGCGSDDEAWRESYADLSALKQDVDNTSHKLEVLQAQLVDEGQVFSGLVAKRDIVTTEIVAAEAEIEVLNAQIAGLKAQAAESAEIGIKLDIAEKRYADLQAELAKYPDLENVVEGLKADKAKLLAEMGVVKPSENDACLTQHEYNKGYFVRIINWCIGTVTYDGLDGTLLLSFKELDSGVVEHLHVAKENGLFAGVSKDDYYAKGGTDTELNQLIDWDVNVYIIENNNESSQLPYKKFSELPDEGVIAIETMRPVVTVHKVEPKAVEVTTDASNSSDKSEGPSKLVTLLIIFTCILGFFSFLAWFIDEEALGLLLLGMATLCGLFAVIFVMAGI